MKISKVTDYAALNHFSVLGKLARGKAEIRNSQFSSVFTKEDESPLSDLGTTITPFAPNIHVDRMMKLLQGLKRHKATGPDEISSRLIKKMASPITPTLTFIFQALLEQGQIPDEWKQPK